MNRLPFCNPKEKLEIPLTCEWRGIDPEQCLNKTSSLTCQNVAASCGTLLFWSPEFFCSKLDSLSLSPTCLLPYPLPPLTGVISTSWAQTRSKRVPRCSHEVMCLPLECEMLRWAVRTIRRSGPRYAKSSGSLSFAWQMSAALLGCLSESSIVASLHTFFKLVIAFWKAKATLKVCFNSAIVFSPRNCSVSLAAALSFLLNLSILHVPMRKYYRCV